MGWGALGLARRGAVVYGFDVLGDELEETGRLTASFGASWAAAAVDVTDEGQVKWHVARVAVLWA